MKITEISNISKYLNNFKIKKIIGIGSTAVCFLLNDERVLKLYYNKPESIFYDDFISHFKNINLVSNDTYIGPDELLVKDNNFIGYVYPYIDAKTLYNKRNMMIIEIINKYDKLLNDTKKISDKRFLLGDLHDKNILVGSLFYIIDLDRGRKHNVMPIEKIFTCNMCYLNKIIIYSLLNVELNQIIEFKDEYIDELYNSCTNLQPELFPQFLESIIEKCVSDKVCSKKIKNHVLYKTRCNSYYKY